MTRNEALEKAEESVERSNKANSVGLITMHTNKSIAYSLIALNKQV